MINAIKLKNQLIKTKTKDYLLVVNNILNKKTNKKTNKKSKPQ